MAEQLSMLDMLGAPAAKAPARPRIERGPRPAPPEQLSMLATLTAETGLRAPIYDYSQFELDNFGRPRVPIRALGRTDYEITVCDWKTGLPVIEVEVRGIGVTCYPSCIMSPGFGAYTHAPEGTPCHSSTGYRSWTGCGITTDDPEGIVAVMEHYIDKKRKGDGTGGLGGQLEPWWSRTISSWAGDVCFELSCGPRENIWNQWENEKPGTWEKAWAKVDAQAVEALAYMARNGIDPNVVLASHRKPTGKGKKWPRFVRSGDTWKMVK